MPRIKIDPGKCTGCRHCEIACSLNHVAGVANPRRREFEYSAKATFSFR